MKTLLSLFFVPYLHFLVKFHVWAIPIAATIFLVKIPELLALLPMLYMFALYTTMNRHQFKENIPWMLATFNKRTLVHYHLLAQTLVLCCQALLTSIMMVGYFTVMIWVMPEWSEQLLPDMTSMGMRGTSAVLTKGVSPLAGTKEQLVLVVVGVFFLITMYSPVSLKDYLRQLEERGGKKPLHQKIRDAILLIALAIILFVIKPVQWMIPLLSLILVAEICYLLWMFNRAFVLFHSRLYRPGLAVAVSAVLLVSIGVREVAVARFERPGVSEARLSELAFLGALAPTITEDDFTRLLVDVKDPTQVVGLIQQHGWANLVKPQQLQDWLLNTKELAIGLSLLKTRPITDRLWQEPRVWEKLDRLFTELYTKNPASASFQAKNLERHLWHAGERTKEQTLSHLGILQQVVKLGLSERQGGVDHRRRILQSKLHSLTETVHWGAGRRPASSSNH